MGKESDLSAAQVIEKSLSFFGLSGLGMNIVDHDDSYARFEGEGGYVFVQAVKIVDQEGSNVSIVARKWGHQIKKFLEEI
jgi:hypothetical protein